MNHALLTPNASRSSPFLAYRVRPTDTLSKIIVEHYGLAYGSADYYQAERALQFSNPEVEDVDKIYPGQIIRLLDRSPKQLAYCPKADPIYEATSGSARHNRPETLTAGEIDRWLALNDLEYSDLSKLNHYWPRTRQQEEAFFTLAWLEYNYAILSTTAGTGLNSLGLLVSPPNRALIAEVTHHWQQYQAGIITQNQYNYRRARALKVFAQKLGPFERVLFKGQTATQAIRINRKKAIPATTDIMRNLQRLSNLSRLTKHGGIFVTLFGGFIACKQIGRTPDRHSQNEIFVEAVGSSLAGLSVAELHPLCFFLTPWAGELLWFWVLGLPLRVMRREREP